MPHDGAGSAFFSVVDVVCAFIKVVDSNANTANERKDFFMTSVLVVIRVKKSFTEPKQNANDNLLVRYRYGKCIFNLLFLA